MWVSSVFNLDLGQTRYFPKDVTQIEVLVDPDQVVPDPVRPNNVLIWRGTMNADDAELRRRAHVAVTGRDATVAARRCVVQRPSREPVAQAEPPRSAPRPLGSGESAMLPGPAFAL